METTRSNCRLAWKVFMSAVAISTLRRRRSRACGVKREHRVLGRIERNHTPRPIRGAVLQMLAEHQPEKLCRNLVVLLVRRCSVDGNGAGLEFLDEAQQARALLFHAA